LAHQRDARVATGRVSREEFAKQRLDQVIVGAAFEPGHPISSASRAVRMRTRESGPRRRTSKGLQSLTARQGKIQSMTSKGFSWMHESASRPREPRWRHILVRQSLTDGVGNLGSSSTIRIVAREVVHAAHRVITYTGLDRRHVVLWQFTPGIVEILPTSNTSGVLSVDGVQHPLALGDQAGRRFHPSFVLARGGSSQVAVSVTAIAALADIGPLFVTL